MKIAEKKQLYNIVVIDDEENNLKSVELALRGQPYSLYLFTDPRQAMEKLPSLHADIILLDILMPELSGFEIMERIKNSSEINAPIIFLTSLSDIKVKRDAYSLGVDDYIIKPLVEEELIFKIEKKIDISRRMEESERTWKMLRSIIEDVMPHEINTPLSSLMLGFYDSENQVHEFEGELKTLFSFIEKNAPDVKSNNFYNYLKSRLENIIKHDTEIKQLLSHSIVRLEKLVKKIIYYNQSFEIKRKPTRLKDLIIDAIRGYDKEIEFSLEDIIADVDGKLLTDCINVLIDNSLIHNQNKVQIAVNCEKKSSEEFQITVIDNGIGIEPVYMQNLFKPYHLAHDIMNHSEGLGLGLYFVKKVIEAHNGTVSVASEPCRETSFTITLPYL